MSLLGQSATLRKISFKKMSEKICRFFLTRLVAFAKVLIREMSTYLLLADRTDNFHLAVLARSQRIARANRNS